MKKYMDRARALQVRQGDEVRICPLWNSTEQDRNKIASPTQVIAVRDRKGGSQTGVLITVKTRAGQIELDAGWFFA